MQSESRRLFLRDVVISVILIVENDEKIIRTILKEISSVLSKTYQNFEILVVDNFSLDNTVGEIKKTYNRLHHIRIISLSKHYNKETALTAGLDNCIGDYAILLNIYTDSAQIIPSLIDKLLSGYDLVIGRYKKDPISKGFLGALLIRLISKISTHEFVYNSSYLLTLNRKAINSITQIRRKSRNFSYLNNLIGFKKAIVEYDPLKENLSRLKQENFLELFFQITDIVISNSFRPMRILVVLGMFISLLFLLYVFVIAILALFFNTYLAPKGWISTSTILGLMFFLLFSLLSLISEYIIRVLGESRNEPLYFITEEIDKSIITIKKNKLNII